MAVMWFNILPLPQWLFSVSNKFSKVRLGCKWNTTFWCSQTVFLLFFIHSWHFKWAFSALCVAGKERNLYQMERVLPRQTFLTKISGLFYVNGNKQHGIFFCFIYIITYYHILEERKIPNCTTGNIEPQHRCC